MIGPSLSGSLPKFVIGNPILSWHSYFRYFYLLGTHPKNVKVRVSPQVLTKDFEIKLFYVTVIVQVPERYGYWVLFQKVMGCECLLRYFEIQLFHITAIVLPDC